MISVNMQAERQAVPLSEAREDHIKHSAMKAGDLLQNERDLAQPAPAYVRWPLLLLH